MTGDHHCCVGLSRNKGWSGHPPDGRSGWFLYSRVGDSWLYGRCQLTRVGWVRRRVIAVTDPAPRPSSARIPAAPIPASSHWNPP